MCASHVAPTDEAPGTENPFELCIRTFVLTNIGVWFGVNLSRRAGSVSA
jgi:hypothetical protein